MGIPPKCPQETILRTKGIPMEKIVLKVRVSVKDRLSRGLRRCRDAATRLRYLMIFNVISGRSTRETAKVLEVHHTTVGRVVDKFRRYGDAGLYDGRDDNGADKPSAYSLQLLPMFHVLTPRSLYPFTCHPSNTPA